MNLGGELHFLGHIIDLAGTAEEPRVRVQLLREGAFVHPKAPGGIFNSTKELIKEVYDNFKAGVKGPRLPGNLNHDDPNFTVSRGWIEDMEIVKGKEGDELIGTIEPTPQIMKHLKDKEIRYISPEIRFNEFHPEKRKKFTAMRGFAWTNIPFIKGMKEVDCVNFSDLDIDDNDTDPDTMTGDPADRPHLDISQAKDADKSKDGLPDQCRSCKLLFEGDCPFSGIPVKMAAAGEGTCPRYEPADSSQDFPEQNPTSQQEVQMTEEQVQALTTRVEAAEKAAEKAQADVVTLSESGGLLLKELEEVKAARRAERIEVMLSDVIRDGRLLPPDIPLAEQVLLKLRGESGTVTLSEAAGGGEVNLDETSGEEDFLALLAQRDPIMSLDESDIDNGRIIERRPKVAAGSVNLSEEVSKLMRERRTAGDPINYGDALREVTRDLKSKGIGLARPPKIEVN